MSADEWDRLKAGDVVVERRSGTPRVVMGVTCRRNFLWGRNVGRPYRIIQMRSLRRGRCDFTVLYPSDWMPRLDVAHGKRVRITKGMQWCDSHGLWHFVGGPLVMNPPLLPRSQWNARGLTERNQ